MLPEATVKIEDSSILVYTVPKSGNIYKNTYDQINTSIIKFRI